MELIFFLFYFNALRGYRQRENASLDRQQQQILFPLFVICNVEKMIATCPERWRNRDLNVEFQCFKSGKHRNTANAKKQI